ncbi:MAG: ABC transporter permease [Nocardiopsaceae bacterium]|jgi:ribose transport system permease protein|nr:ABC transporter permease [Nocardiopsaceae bacterium]
MTSGQPPGQETPGTQPSGTESPGTGPSPGGRSSPALLRGLTWPPPALRGPRPARAVRLQEFAIVGVCLALFIGLTVASPAFLTGQNIRNILDQNSALGIIACGETIVIISGSFDLSVGAIYAVAGIIAVILSNQVGPAAGIAAAIGCGLVLGALNGAFVVFGRVHSFIATLASQYIFNGLALVISGGLIIQSRRAGFAVIGQYLTGGVNVTIWILAVVVIVTALLLGRTTWGRHVFAVGGNQEAARLSGIRVSYVRGSVFALSGTAAALAGVIAASRVGTAQAGTGTGLELAAIATTVLGGTSIFGGEGAIWRTVLGVLLIAMIGNGFNLLSLSATYQQVVEGVLIILAVTVDAYTRLRR